MEESAKRLLLLLVVRRVQRNVEGLAVESVRHKHSILVVVVCGSQDITALDRLFKEAKDVHNDQNALGGLLGGTRHIGLLTVNGLVVALLLIALGDDGRDVAAGG